MKKKIAKKVFSLCMAIAVIFCFTVTPVSQVFLQDSDSIVYAKTTKKTTKKSSSSKGKSTKSTKKSSGKTNSSKSTKSSNTKSKSNTSSKGSSSSSKDYKKATESNTGNAKSPGGSDLDSMKKKYKYVIIGADGYIHGSNESYEKAASYDGGAQKTPVTKDQLQKNENKGAYKGVTDLPPKKDEVYLIGSNANDDQRLADGLKALGYKMSNPPTEKEITKALGQWKNDSGNGNDYVSTIGASNVQKLLDAADNASKGNSGSYRPRYEPEPGEEDPKTTMAECRLVFAEITSTPKDGKAYFTTEKVTFEVRYVCDNVYNYDSKNLLKEVRVGDKVYSVDTPSISGNMITYEGTIFLTEYKAGTHTLDYINNEDKKIGSDDFLVQTAGIVIPKDGDDVDKDGTEADEYNIINHTKKWNDNRIDFNKNSSEDKLRSYNTFWIGEEATIKLRYNMPVDADKELTNKYYGAKAELRKGTKDGTLVSTLILKAPEKVTGKDGYTHEQKTKFLATVDSKKATVNSLKNGTYWFVIKNKAGEEVISSKIIFNSTVEYYSFHRTSSSQTSSRFSSSNLPNNY